MKSDGGADNNVGGFEHGKKYVIIRTGRESNCLFSFYF